MGGTVASRPAGAEPREPVQSLPKPEEGCTAEAQADQGNLGMRLLRTTAFTGVGVLDTIGGGVNSVLNLAVRPASWALGSDFRLPDQHLVSRNLTTNGCDLRAASSAGLAFGVATLAVSGPAAIRNVAAAARDTRIGAAISRWWNGAPEALQPPSALALRSSPMPVSQRQALPKPTSDTTHNVRLNEQELARLHATPLSTRGTGRITEATPQDIQAVYNAVSTGNVAGLHRLSHYDPKGEFGLCYGRAFSGYVEALRHGISRDAIRKVWLVGRPNGPEGQVWSFHVATAVRGQNNQWYALDTLHGRPQTVESWMHTVTSRHGLGSSRFYATEPQRWSTPRNPVTPGAAVRHFLTEDRADAVFFRDLLAESRRRAGR